MSNTYHNRVLKYIFREKVITSAYAVARKYGQVSLRHHYSRAIKDLIAEGLLVPDGTQLVPHSRMQRIIDTPILYESLLQTDDLIVALRGRMTGQDFGKGLIAIGEKLKDAGIVDKAMQQNDDFSKLLVPQVQKICDQVPEDVQKDIDKALKGKKKDFLLK